MDYEEFKNALVDVIALNANSCDTIRIEMTPDGTEGITFTPCSVESSMYPLVELAGFYEDFLDTNDIERVAASLLGIFVDLWSNVPERPYCDDHELRS